MSVLGCSIVFRFISFSTVLVVSRRQNDDDERLYEKVLFYCQFSPSRLQT